MRRKGLLLALGVVCAACLLSSRPSYASPAAEAPEIKLVATEVSLGRFHRGIVGESVTVSPDSKRVAYAARSGRKWLVVVDGVEGKEYDGIMAGTPVFSPDSKCVAYAPERGNKRMAVVDGVEGKEYEAFLKGSRLVFDSPSQSHTLALRGEEFLRLEVEIVSPAAGSGAPR